MRRRRGKLTGPGVKPLQEACTRPMWVCGGQPLQEWAMTQPHEGRLAWAETAACAQMGRLPFVAEADVRRY